MFTIIAITLCVVIIGGYLYVDNKAAKVERENWN